MTHTSQAPPDALLADRLDLLPLSRLHLAAATLCSIGFAFDLLEVALGSALAAIFSAPAQGVTPVALSWLLASVYIGAIFGAPLMGAFADRYGRRLALVVTLAWLAGTSILAAASPDIFYLTLARVLSGIALGAYPPLMFAYLTDLLPPRARAPTIFVTVAVAALGAPAGVFLVRWLTPIQPLGMDAWRWAFVLGLVGAAVVAILFKVLPESPRWLKTRGRDQEAEQAFRRLASSPPVRWPPSSGAESASPSKVRTATIMVSATAARLRLVGLLYFLSPWSTVAFSLLIGAVLMGKGFKLTDTLFYVGAATFGPFIGSLFAALVIDRMERRVALGACAAAMAIFGLAFSASQSPFWLVLSSIAFTLVSAVYVPTLTLYGAEVVPTAKRASFSAIAWACNRCGAALAPLLLLPVLNTGGPYALYAAIAATLGASIVLLIALPRVEPQRAVG